MSYSSQSSICCNAPWLLCSRLFFHCWKWSHRDARRRFRAPNMTVFLDRDGKIHSFGMFWDTVIRYPKWVSSIEVVINVGLFRIKSIVRSTSYQPIALPTYILIACPNLTPAWNQPETSPIALSPTFQKNLKKTLTHRTNHTINTATAISYHPLNELSS